MIAARHGSGIHMSDDIAKALSGLTKGYRVEMHDPIIRVAIFVDADTVDKAHQLAIGLCRREAIGFKQTGATIVRIG